jgi:hypothetical protein
MKPQSSPQDPWKSFALAASATRTLVVLLLFGVVVVAILRRGGSGADTLRAALVTFLTVTAVMMGLWLIPALSDRTSRWMRRARYPAWVMIVLVTLPSVLSRPPLELASPLFVAPAFAWAVLIGLAGLVRLREWRALDFSAWVETAALLYAAVAGVVLMVDALNIRPLGFSSLILRLTVTHYCFAGFAASVLAAQAVRFSLQRVPSAVRPAEIAAIGIVLGTPLTAIGITVRQLGGGSYPEWLAVAALAASTLLLAGLNAWLGARYVPSPTARLLLLAGSASLTLGIILAVTYALGLVPGLGIPQMLQTHGLLNSLGFTLLSLVAWHIIGIRLRREQKIGAVPPDATSGDQM